MTDDDPTGPRPADAAWPQPDQLKALLRLALETPNAADRWMPSQSAADASRRLAALGQSVGTPAAGLLEQAVAPTASIVELIRARDTAQKLAECAKQEDDRDAALLLYHVAVANAFYRHGVDLCHRPVSTCRQLYDQFATRFAGFAVGEIFGQAIALIDKNGGSSS